MFEPKGEVSQHEALYRAINHKATGIEIPYDALPVPREQAIRLKDKVSKLFEREQNRHLECVRGVGWVLVSGSAQVDASIRRSRKATRIQGRALQIVETVDRTEMSADERKRTDEVLINSRLRLGFLRGTPAGKRLKLEDVVAWSKEQAS